MKAAVALMLTDAAIAELSSKVPDIADKRRFEESIRSVAGSIANWHCNSSITREEIKALYWLNEHVDQGRDTPQNLVDKLTSLSPSTRQWLLRFGRRALPQPCEFLSADDKTGELAVINLRSALSYGGQWKRRERPGGKHSFTFEPLLVVPTHDTEQVGVEIRANRHRRRGGIRVGAGRPRDFVVRNVIEMLATTYAEATNEKTPNTVNEEIRGPFWNFVDHFLKLMRLPRGNITRLINERGWRRQAIEVLGAQSSSPPMPISKSEPTSKIRDWLLAQYALDPNISTMHLASELDKRKDLVKRRVSYHAIDYFFIREGLRKTPPRQSPSARRKSLGITRTKPRWP